MIDQVYDPDQLASLADFHAKYSIDQTAPAAAPAAQPALLPTLVALVDAVAEERRAHDAYQQSESSAVAEEYEDACATTVIRENAARAIIKEARLNTDASLPAPSPLLLAWADAIHAGNQNLARQLYAVIVTVPDRTERDLEILGEYATGWPLCPCGAAADATQAPTPRCTVCAARDAAAAAAPGLPTFVPLIAVPSNYGGHGGWALATIFPGWQVHTQARAAMPAPNASDYARLFAASPALFAACITLLNADACEDEEEQDLLLAEGIEAARAAVYPLLDR